MSQSQFDPDPDVADQPAARRPPSPPAGGAPTSEPDPRRDRRGDRRARRDPVHEGHARGAGLRLLGPHGRHAAVAGGAVRGRRHPARPAHPPGALGDLELADDPAAVRRTASWSAAATSSPRCTSRASSRRRCGSVLRARMASVAVATDSTHYLPARARRRSRASTRSACTSAGPASPSASSRWRLRRLLCAPAHRPRAADHLAALDRRLPRGVGAAARRRPRRRLDPPRRRHLGHLRGRAPGARRCSPSAGSASASR